MRKACRQHSTWWQASATLGASVNCRPPAVILKIPLVARMFVQSEVQTREKHTDLMIVVSSIYLSEAIWEKSLIRSQRICNHDWNMDAQIPFPVVISREDKWFVASCPILDIATQGRAEKEVKENIAELIDEYLKDPDTVKPRLDQLLSISLTNIPVIVPEAVLHRKASTITSTQGN